MKVSITKTGRTKAFNVKISDAERMKLKLPVGIRLSLDNHTIRMHGYRWLRLYESDEGNVVVKLNDSSDTYQVVYRTGRTPLKSAKLFRAVESEMVSYAQGWWVRFPNKEERKYKLGQKRKTPTTFKTVEPKPKPKTVEPANVTEAAYRAMDYIAKEVMTKHYESIVSSKNPIPTSVAKELAMLRMEVMDIAIAQKPKAGFFQRLFGS